MYRERYDNLIAAISDDYELLEFVSEQLPCFAAYVDAVYNMETQLPILRFRLEGEDYREEVVKMDRRRRDAHEAAIIACSCLGRVAERVNVDTIYSGDASDRYAIADFCVAIVNEMFKEATGGETH